jgi:protein SCO1/2
MMATRRYGADYFSNVTLTTHEGERVRFYDDLIRGKTVAFNMMYAQCDGICPTMTANLVKVQSMLGDRVGRDVFMYSITLDPERDTPRDLKVYAAVRGVKPGWLFLTGAPADVRLVRYRLGFYDPDPAVDGLNATHTGAVRIGNDVRERWTMAPALAKPESILFAINHVDPTVSVTGRRR